MLERRIKGTLMPSPSANRRVVLACLAVLGAVVIVFLHYLVGGGTLIGDSDRLNAFLNVRKFEIEALTSLHRIPAWSDRVFMGNGTAGLHYMLPGAGIFAYLESIVPLPDLFHVMTFVTMALVILAGISAFLFLREVCKSEFPAVIGAVLYCTSVYTIHRSAQLDASIAVLIHIPIAMLLVRRISPTALVIPFVGLGIVITSLLLFTFLQEAAYALVLFGCYAIHRSVVSRSPAPMLVLLAAGTIAVLVSSPRVITVLEDFRELARTKDFQQTSWIEIYRFFAEGFFGRFQGEGRSIGNGTNLHEGLQLVGSTLAALLVILGAISRGAGMDRAAGFLLLIVASMTLGGPFYKTYTSIQSRVGAYSTELVILVVNLSLGLLALLIVIGRRAIAGSPKKPPRLFVHADDDVGRDFLFFTLILTGVLCVVLVTEARHLFYRLFFRVDFTHARFSIAALLPLCAMVAMLLRALLPTSAGNIRVLSTKAVAVASIAAIAAVWIIEGSLLTSLVDYLGIRPIRVAWNYALPLEATRLAVWFIIFVSLVTLLWRASAQHTQWRECLVLGLGVAIAAEGTIYAQFKLTGPHTRDHSAPFKHNNYMNASPSDLRPPTKAAQDRLSRALESDAYRSVFIASTAKYPAFVAPHLANFWGLRVVDGYSAGVPRRLASFDWPGEVRTLRSIAFGSVSQVPWELVGYLNVKFGIQVNDDLYFNRTSECVSTRTSGCVPQPKLHRNPFDPIPRHFFAGSIEPGGLPLSRPQATDRPDPPRAVVATAVGERGVLLSWNAPWGSDVHFVVEERRSDSPTFHTVGHVGPSGRTYLKTDVVPGAMYFFRLQSCRQQQCSAYSPGVSVLAASSGINTPRDLKVVPNDASSLKLLWRDDNSTPSEYVIERQRGPNAPFNEEIRTHKRAAEAILSFSALDSTDNLRMRACNERGCSAHSEVTSIAEWLGGVLTDAPRLPLPIDLRKTSFVEGIEHSRQLSTHGRLEVRYEGDYIEVRIDSAPSERFLVINEMYHPRWKAFADGQELKVYPVNTVMRGVFIPPATSLVTLKFVPFLYTPLALVIFILSIGIGTATTILMIRIQSRGRQLRRSSDASPPNG